MRRSQLLQAACTEADALSARFLLRIDKLADGCEESAEAIEHVADTAEAFEPRRWPLG